MKKIVGILAAAAIATSVFADISATAKVKSTLFKANDGAIDLLGTLENAQASQWDTLFKLSVSNDNAGGSVVYYGAAEQEKPVNFAQYNVWFKPTDAIKLSFRENSLGLMGQKYKGYYEHNVAGAGAGYGLQFAADALTFDVVLGENFVTKAKDAEAKIGQLGAKVGYNADFGSLAAVFSADANFKKFEVGAGYSGNFDAVGVVFNAGAKIADDKTTIGLVGSAGGSVDAISWAIDVFADIADATKVGTYVKAAYAFEPATATLYFEDTDFSADKFGATIGLKFNGNVGAASWEVDPHFTTADSVFAVGFNTAISF